MQIYMVNNDFSSIATRHIFIFPIIEKFGNPIYECFSAIRLPVSTHYST